MFGIAGTIVTLDLARPFPAGQKSTKDQPVFDSPEQPVAVRGCRVRRPRSRPAALKRR